MRNSAHFLLVLPLLALAGRATAQSIAIGTPTPNASALLDLSSTAKGLLPPRLSQAQLNAMGPAAGLLAYNTTTGQLVLWNGTAWQTLLSVPFVPAATAQSFTTPGTFSYTVPAGVFALNAGLVGATGGLGDYLSSSNAGAPGTGGTATARLFVNPGDVVSVWVGGRGQNVTSANRSAGGFNGGGTAGNAGGGGGGTDLRLYGSGIANRVLVAGGGGGGPSNQGGYTGGSGGYPTGQDGTDGYSNGVLAGKGGTQSAGGAGGQPYMGYGAAGNGGTLWQGGNLGSNNTGGGGGGGGYYGGGGGGYLDYTNSPGHAITVAGGGGGGGSSYAGAGTGLASFQTIGNTRTPADGSATLTPVTAAAAPVLDATNFINLPTSWQSAGGTTVTTYAGDNVLIGAAGTTNAKLEVVGNSQVHNGPIEVRNENASSYIWFHEPSVTWYSMGMDRSDNDNFKISEGNNPENRSFRNYLTINRSNGFVGLGAMAPVAPLEVRGKLSIGQYDYAWYNIKPVDLIFLTTQTAQFGYYGGGTPTDVTIRAEGRFLANEFSATSDQRLKRIIGLSDRPADLARLRQLRITDYQMRDRARYGDRLFKKVIAQEVEKVFPQAVSQQRDFLPDIYAVATRAEALPGDSLLRLTLPAAPAEPLRAGQRLRLVGSGEVVATVVRAAGPVLTLRGARQLAGQPVFVFGREQADVRSVDYEALAMLNISATQALDDQLLTLRTQQAQVLQRTEQARQAARQAGQEARQATDATAAAEATLRAFEQQLAAAEARAQR